MNNILTRDGGSFAYPVAAGAAFEKLALVAINAAGYAVSGSDAEAGDTVVGVAYDDVDNAAGAAGAKVVSAYSTVVGLESADITGNTAVGETAYTADGITATAVSEGTVSVGKIVAVSEGRVWIRVGA